MYKDFEKPTDQDLPIHQDNSKRSPRTSQNHITLPERVGTSLDDAMDRPLVSVYFAARRR